MDLISEHIGNKNNLGKIVISHEKLATDSFSGCKIRNISTEGMYIECDFIFCLEERVNFNARNSVNHAKTDYFRFPSATVKWKKDLEDSDFKHGYGVQFAESLQFPEKFITNTKAKRRSLFPLSISEIIGFAGFIVYLFLRIFFGSELVPEPFEFAIIGLGLVIFAKLIKKQFKINLGKRGFILSRISNPRSPERNRQKRSL